MRSGERFKKESYQCYEAGRYAVWTVAHQPFITTTGTTVNPWRWNPSVNPVISHEVQRFRIAVQPAPVQIVSINETQRSIPAYGNTSVNAHGVSIIGSVV